MDPLAKVPINEELYRQGVRYVEARLRNPGVAPSVYFTNSKDNPIGQLALTEVVGRGEYGEVRAVCIDGKKFAIKTESGMSGTRPVIYLEWFIRMFITMKDVTPHVGRFEGLLVNRVIYRAIMDAHGFTLYARFAAKPMGHKQKLRYFVQCMKALEALHSVNIMHHDLHAHNIMFDRRSDLTRRGVTHMRYPDGTTLRFDGNFLRLIDFGFSSLGQHRGKNPHYPSNTYFVDVLIAVRAFRMSSVLRHINNFILAEVGRQYPDYRFSEAHAFKVKYVGAHIDQEYVRSFEEILRPVTPTFVLRMPEIQEFLASNQASSELPESRVMDVWEIARTFVSPPC